MNVGNHEGTIISHRSKMLGDKIAMAITCKIGNEQGEAMIFLTEKAAGMARRAFKVCGFDVDIHDVAELDVNQTMLAGRKIPLVVDLYNGKTQIKVDLDGRADRATLSSFTKKMREAKKRDDSDGGEAPVGEPGKTEPDYGDVPF